MPHDSLWWDQYRHGLDCVLSTTLAPKAVSVPVPVTSRIPVLGFVLSGRGLHGSSGQWDRENLHGSMLITFKGGNSNMDVTFVCAATL